LYFLTTLYVDVKEPAFRTFRGKKKLNLPPIKMTSPFLIERDKIESICSPKMYKNNPDYTGARGQRDEQISPTRSGVNRGSEDFFIFLSAFLIPSKRGRGRLRIAAVCAFDVGSFAQSRVAHTSRVLAIASRNRELFSVDGTGGRKQGLLRRDIATSTRDVCATREWGCLNFAFLICVNGFDLADYGVCVICRS
jgi:hypothetical protein